MKKTSDVEENFTSFLAFNLTGAQVGSWEEV
jgi:hypothetical protein